jgi:hypothetical protein
MSKHATDGVSPFANLQMSDETVTAWADRTDHYASRPISLGNHRNDYNGIPVIGYEFDYDTLTYKPVD